MDQNYEGEIKRWIVLTQDILGAKDINTTDKIVLAHISGFEQFYASNEATAEFLGLTPRTIQGVKQKLVRLGYIVVTKDTGRGKIYQLNVARLTKFCQPDSQNSVNQTDKILSPYNKKKNKDKVFIGENDKNEPVENSFGREDINELAELWERETGVSIKGQQTQRCQLYNLTRKYGIDKTRGIIKLAGRAAKSRDRYAPIIATPSELTGKFEKLSKLRLWYMRNKATQPANTTVAAIKREGADYNGAWDDPGDAERARVREMFKQARAGGVIKRCNE